MRKEKWESTRRYESDFIHIEATIPQQDTTGSWTGFSPSISLASILIIEYPFPFCVVQTMVSHLEVDKNI